MVTITVEYCSILLQLLNCGILQAPNVSCDPHASLVFSIFHNQLMCSKNFGNLLVESYVN